MYYLLLTMQKRYLHLIHGSMFCIEIEEGFDPKITAFSLDPAAFPADLTANLEKSKKESWDKLTNWSKRCYLTSSPPGKVSNNPTSGFPNKFESEAPSSEESQKGLENFTVIKVFIEEIEWLFLASQGHRRALFKITRDNSNLSIESKWLVP